MAFYAKSAFRKKNVFCTHFRACKPTWTTNPTENPIYLDTKIQWLQTTNIRPKFSWPKKSRSCSNFNHPTPCRWKQLSSRWFLSTTRTPSWSCGTGAPPRQPTSRLGGSWVRCEKNGDIRWYKLVPFFFVVCFVWYFKNDFSFWPVLDGSEIWLGAGVCSNRGIAVAPSGRLISLVKD